MNSFNKIRLIQSLKEKGDTPCMISNIINDYGSLKIANVGISFSDNNNIQNLIQDYIISEENDINSILYLLMEGKVSLINSIQIFKTIIICSFIQLISFILLLYSRSFYTYKYFIISDILIIIPISFLVSKTDTNKKLNEHKLTGGLINPTTLLSLLFQTILIFFFQFLSIILLNIEEWSKLSSQNYNNTLFFYISNYQYLIIAISFSITYPFKKSIFTNTLLIVYLISGFSYFTYIFFTPNNFSSKLLNLTFFPSYIFRNTFIIVCFLNLISSYLCESYLVPYAIYYYFKDNNEKSQIL
jgi:cation-transporting ATPase 13A3/4/5